jgi:transposase-like protein
MIRKMLPEKSCPYCENKKVKELGTSFDVIIFQCDNCGKKFGIERRLIK